MSRELAITVKSVSGSRFALLGKAGGFLHPIFSSGVIIAFRSASLVAALDRQFAGETVDWQAEFAAPLLRRMISAALAGYAWDTTHPYGRDAARRLAALEQLCCGL